MNYQSTRGGMAELSFTDTVLEGLAPDGGLALPTQFPQISAATLKLWRALPYPALAAEIIGLYASDIPKADLGAMTQRAYTVEKFGSPEITPVQQLGPGLYLQHLSNGPTLAFKDMAMQFLGELFEYILDQKNTTLNILGATSGDTGSSAEYAMLGKSRVKVFMLSPYGKMSAFQTAQMFSLNAPNIFNIALKGVFDDCQDLVKILSNDLKFKQKYRLGAVNSINWARIVAQVVYYFKGYLAVSKDETSMVDFVVPSGNFGNIFAGFVARKMGLPIRRLILATNENNVLDEFFRTGCYRPRGASEVSQTSSPSMDIAKASNFERFIFDIAGAERTRELWQQLEQHGEFNLAADPLWKNRDQWGIFSGTSTHTERMAMIANIQQKYGVLIDTHTADGLQVGLQFATPEIPLICLETAMPAKFAESIQEAVGIQPPRPAQYKGIESLPQHFTVMDKNAEELQLFIVEHV